MNPMPDPRLDLKAFWRWHDARLPGCDDRTAEASVDLIHNLYRGMPAPFNRFFAIWQRRAIGVLVRVDPPRPGEWVLDLGCGTGRWSRFFQRYGASTVGVDLGIQALRWARQLSPSARWAAMEIPRLGFRDHSFDWVVSVTVLQHLPHEVQEEALCEVRRLLRPSGRLLALELCRGRSEGFHVFPRSRREWEDLFTRLGFRILKRQASERLPWIPALRRLARRKRGSVAEEQMPLVEWAADRFHRSPVLWIALYLFLAIAYPLEGLAAAVGLDRWARYTGWLLRRED